LNRESTVLRHRLPTATVQDFNVWGRTEGGPKEREGATDGRLYEKINNKYVLGTKTIDLGQGTGRAWPVKNYKEEGRVQ